MGYSWRTEPSRWRGPTGSIVRIVLGRMRSSLRNVPTYIGSDEIWWTIARREWISCGWRAYVVTDRWSNPCRDAIYHRHCRSYRWSARSYFHCPCFPLSTANEYGLRRVSSERDWQFSDRLDWSREPTIYVPHRIASPQWTSPPPSVDRVENVLEPIAKSNTSTLFSWWPYPQWRHSIGCHPWRSSPCVWWIEPTRSNRVSCTRTWCSDVLESMECNLDATSCTMLDTIEAVSDTSAHQNEAGRLRSHELTDGNRGFYEGNDTHDPVRRFAWSKIARRDHVGFDSTQNGRWTTAGANRITRQSLCTSIGSRVTTRDRAEDHADRWDHWEQSNETIRHRSTR